MRWTKTMIRSKKILNAAKNQDCTLRLDGCTFDSEQTIAAHVGVRRGMAIKCGDNMVVFACANCHSQIDGANRKKLALDILRAVEETQEILINKELMVVA